MPGGLLPIPYPFAKNSMCHKANYELPATIARLRASLLTSNFARYTWREASFTFKL